MRYGRTDFFPWGCYSGKLSALSDSPSHKRKSWSTQESLRSVDAVENWLAHLQQVLSFPSFTQSSGQALGAPLATRRAEKPPVPAAGTPIALHHRCSAWGLTAAGSLTSRTSVLLWKLQRFDGYPLFLYDLFLQDPAVIFTSAEYLRVCVRLEAVHAFKPQSDWGFPNKREEGGWVIDFPVIFGCDNVQELQLLLPWNSSPEWIHTYLYLWVYSYTAHLGFTTCQPWSRLCWPAP